MWLPSKRQVDTATRYVGVVAGTAFTIFGLQAKGFDISQVQRLITQLGETINTLVTLAAAAGALYATVRGVNASSSASQIGAVTDIANNPQNPQSDTAKVALLNATASIVSQPAASGAVVDASAPVKAALLDATAALPEVTRPIPVTDDSLVAATQSPLVVKEGD